MWNQLFSRFHAHTIEKKVSSQAEMTFTSDESFILTVRAKTREKSLLVLLLTEHVMDG